MCYNARTSFVVWLLSTGFSTYMTKRPMFSDRWLGSFGNAVAAIQFLEWFAWLGHADKIKGFVLPVLWWQCMVNSTYLARTDTRFKGLPLVYAALAIDSILKNRNVYMRRPSDQGYVQGKALVPVQWCHMSWSGDEFRQVPLFDWARGIMYVSGLVVPFFLVPKDVDVRYMGWIGLSTFATSFGLYPHSKASSMWCFVACCVMPLVYTRRLFNARLVWLR